MIEIINAVSNEHYKKAAQLFSEYASSLSFDLSFQNFDEELASLPGDYIQPAGCLLLAIFRGDMAGCVALRPLSHDICEMKRLYVRPAFRAQGIGRALANAIIVCGSKAGYQKMRLDTVSSMREAVLLYTSIGFREIEPYRYNPIEGAQYLELDLGITRGNDPELLQASIG